MKVRNFMLADAVDVGPQGKVFVHGGGIGNIAAATFPWTHPQLSLLISLEREREKYGTDYEFEMRFLDPQRRPIMPSLRVSFRFGRPEVEGAPVVVNLSVSMGGLSFPEPGQYEIQAWIDGRILDNLPLLLQPVPSPADGAQDSRDPSSEG